MQLDDRANVEGDLDDGRCGSHRCSNSDCSVVISRIVNSRLLINLLVHRSV